MPTYVYRCQQCGVTIERRQTFTEDRLTICEACSGELRRVLQPVSVIYKGSGFYTTDYKNAPGSSRPDAKGGSPADGNSSDGSPSESGSSESGSSDGESKGTSEPPATASSPTASSSDGKKATATTAPAAPSSTASSN